MKTYFHYIVAFIFSAALLTACSDKDETTTVSKGQADFSTYVALGNSLTAGYADNALYFDGQEVAYPNLLAGQLKNVGGGDFKQPYVDANSVGVGSDGNARLVLGVSNGDLAPVPAAAQGDLSIFLNSVADQGPFNNMGVPGATVLATVFPGYGNPANGEGNFNPFFTRMTTSPAGASMLGDAAAQDPTFFTLFIGNNDVLSYATSGGITPITPMEGGIGEGFSATYDYIVATMTSNGAKGALANIPNVTSTPFFTFIPWNVMELAEEQAAQLNGAFDQLLQGLGMDREIAATMGIVPPKFQGGNNGVLVRVNDPTNVLGIRHLTEGELVLLTAQGALQEMSQNIGNAGQIIQEIGAGFAMGDYAAVRAAAQKLAIPYEFYLGADQLERIENATNSYNTKIKATAEAHDLAFVDINGFFTNIANRGINVNGRQITTEFVTGGAFSLDGIHLTPMGNVLLANEFIKAINRNYNAFIPEVDPSPYGGVRFP